MQSSSDGLPFHNPELPLEQRIDDLVARLSLEEKINQLLHDNNAVERLDVPAYNWWSEACHGVGRNGRATVFPQVIGLAATWNPTLLREIGDAIANEARAKHHAAAAAGRRGQYQGLTFWTPNVNIFRDPRWGRGQETFGEDPFLTGELGFAMVQGLQGDHPFYLKVAACAKHFAVHSGPEAERHSFDVNPSSRDMEETYLPAFEKLVRGGVEAVMGAYNRVRGEPACASRFLLNERLRGEWGFKGHVVSDCGAIDDFHHGHHVTASPQESAALAVRMGCDLNCGCTYNDLVVAVREGLISEREIEVSLRRLLATKFRLGLFDPPEHVPYTAAPVSVIGCDAHRNLARRAAAESIVLLKNSRQVLPLRRELESLLIVGPTAANHGALLGNYYGVNARMITIAEGLVEQVSEGTRVEYRPGTPLCQPYAPGTNYTFGAASASEAVIAVMGLDHTLEGEEGDTVASTRGGDREAIELPENQRKFLRELRQHCKTLVLVLTGGSAIAIPEEHELCDAVLHAWYPGCEGGRAVADVIFGDVSPSGHLPVTIPFRTEDLPAFNDYSMAGRTYRFAHRQPLYPFGFGLSYAQFRHHLLSCDRKVLAQGDEVTVRISLENGSDRAAAEVVQCYIAPEVEVHDAPKATLVAFKRVHVGARSTEAVEFRLPSSVFMQVDSEGKRTWRPGPRKLVIGAASPGFRALALGAPTPVVTTLQLR